MENRFDVTITGLDFPKVKRQAAEEVERQTELGITFLQARTHRRSNGFRAITLTFSMEPTP
jgi:hypothetical protein